MDNRSDVREFLTSRRARIAPDQAGLPAYGKTRRVAGVAAQRGRGADRNECEVLHRLERGNLAGVSEAVIESLARALQPDEAERAHLFDLARAAGTSSRSAQRSPEAQVRHSIYRVWRQ